MAALSRGACGKGGSRADLWSCRPSGCSTINLYEGIMHLMAERIYHAAQHPLVVCYYVCSLNFCWRNYHAITQLRIHLAYCHFNWLQKVADRSFTSSCTRRSNAKTLLAQRVVAGKNITGLVIVAVCRLHIYEQSSCRCRSIEPGISSTVQISMYLMHTKTLAWHFSYFTSESIAALGVRGECEGSLVLHVHSSNLSQEPGTTQSCNN